jgi:hypothetical protein
LRFVASAVRLLEHANSIQRAGGFLTGLPMPVIGETGLPMPVIGETGLPMPVIGESATVIGVRSQSQDDAGKVVRSSEVGRREPCDEAGGLSPRLR